MRRHKGGAEYGSKGQIFHESLDPGENLECLEISNIIVEPAANEKNRKDERENSTFVTLIADSRGGNTLTACNSYGMTEIEPLGPTTNAPPSG